MFSNRHPLLLTFTAALCFVMTACGGDGEVQDDDQQQQQQDEDNGEELEPDRLEDPQDACEEAIDRNAEFAIPTPEGASAVGVPELARVGDELWLTFLAVVELEGEEVEKGYMARLDCGGEVLEGPEAVGSAEPRSESAPALGTDGAVVYLAWHEMMEKEENGEIVQAPTVWLQAFDPDGTATSTEPAALTFDVDVEGQPIESANSPDVDVSHGGQAVVVAEWRDGGSPKVLMGRFDESGQPDGAAFYLESTGSNPQLAPVVSVREDYHVFFAFVEQVGWAEGQVRHGTVRPDGESVDEGPTAAEPDVGAGGENQTVAVSKSSAGDNTWFAYEMGSAADNHVRVRTGREVGVVDGEDSTVEDRQSVWPAVAASEMGGAKAWLSGGEEGARIHFRRFVGAVAAIPESGPVIDQHDEDVATGGPDIVWLTDEIFAAVWPEVDGEGSELVGRIIDFEREEDE